MGSRGQFEVCDGATVAGVGLMGVKVDPETVVRSIKAEHDTKSCQIIAVRTEETQGVEKKTAAFLSIVPRDSDRYSHSWVKLCEPEDLQGLADLLAWLGYLPRPLGISRDG